MVILRISTEDPLRRSIQANYEGNISYPSTLSCTDSSLLDHSNLHFSLKPYIMNSHLIEGYLITSDSGVYFAFPFLLVCTSLTAAGILSFLNFRLSAFLKLIYNTSSILARTCHICHDSSHHHICHRGLDQQQLRLKQQ